LSTIIIILFYPRLIHCKFFKRGDGTCPFGSHCFYLHVDKHGQAVQLAAPRRRQRLNARGELENYSDVFMVPVFSQEDYGRLFNESVSICSLNIVFFSLTCCMFISLFRYDFLFDDDDDHNDNDDDHNDDDNASLNLSRTNEDRILLVDEDISPINEETIESTQ
jgi:hypothetical protein